MANLIVETLKSIAFVLATVLIALDDPGDDLDRQLSLDPRQSVVSAVFRSGAPPRARL